MSRPYGPGGAKRPSPLLRGVYLGWHELYRDLVVMVESLRECGATAAAEGAVQDLVRLVEVFGVHVLTLDIRQHSARHREALGDTSAGPASVPVTLT